MMTPASTTTGVFYGICDWLRRNPSAGPIAAGLAVTTVALVAVAKSVLGSSPEKSQTFAPEPDALKHYLMHERGSAYTVKQMKAQVEHDLTRQEFIIDDQRYQNYGDLTQALRGRLKGVDPTEDQLTTIAYLGCQRVLTPLADEIGDYARTPASHPRSTFVVNSEDRTVSIESVQQGTLRQMGQDGKSVVAQGDYSLSSRAIYHLDPSNFTIEGKARVGELTPLAT